MTEIDRKAPVMVTGATGYVAGWLVKKLLDEGLTVHAAVRDPGNEKKIAHLVDMADKAEGEIKFFKADLLETGSYADSMDGCQLVYHTASPFKTRVKDAQRDLVDPAKLGTKNVLDQANQVESVKRIVVTSSCAAIYGDNADLEKTPNGVFTEEIWNTSSTLNHGAYSYSKVEAEKEAWRVAEAQSRWDLVTVNPSLVLGPALNPGAVTSESFRIIRQFGDGTLSTGAPRLGMGLVDVRDVAFAHYQAGFTPEAKGRYITSGHNSSFLEMGKLLHQTFGKKYPIPNRAVPKWILWLFGPFVDKALTRDFVSKNIDLPWKADNSKGKKELGVTYRELTETLNETFQQLIDEGILKSR